MQAGGKEGHFNMAVVGSSDPLVVVMTVAVPEAEVPAGLCVGGGCVDAGGRPGVHGLCHGGVVFVVRDDCGAVGSSNGGVGVDCGRISCCCCCCCRRCRCRNLVSESRVMGRTLGVGPVACVLISRRLER